MAVTPRTLCSYGSKPANADNLGDRCFVCVLAVGAAFDEFPAVPFLTADGLLQGDTP